MKATVKDFIIDTSYLASIPEALGTLGMLKYTCGTTIIYTTGRFYTISDVICKQP